MAVDAHADFLQLAFEDIGGLLAGVLGDDNTSDIESLVGKGLDQAKDIHVVGNAQVMADLILFDVRGIDGDDDLSLICKLQQHAELTVRRKAGKNSGGVVIVE